jgi:hypothetical protein
LQTLICASSIWDVPASLTTSTAVSLLGIGNLRTTDQSGPFNFTLLPAQVGEIKGEAINPSSFLYHWQHCGDAQRDLRLARRSSCAGSRL